MITLGDTMPCPGWTSVISFDPGVWTGWAWCLFDWSGDLSLEDWIRGRVVVGAGSSWEWSEVCGPSLPFLMGGELDCSASENKGVEAMARYVRSSTERAERYLSDNPGRRSCTQPLQTIVICESFELRQMTKDRSLLSPVRLGSALDYALYRGDGGSVQELIWQSSSQMSVMTDDRIKRLGLWVPGQPHRMDALRHLILWSRTQASSWISGYR